MNAERDATVDDEHPDALPAGFEIAGYRIVRVLGRGGFAFTYLAEQVSLNRRRVAIKEYYPQDYAQRRGDQITARTTRESREVFRWGLEKFRDEGRWLARFDDDARGRKHPNIVGVKTLEEALGTAYLVMEYVEGESLRAYYERHGDGVPEGELKQIAGGMLEGLSALHAEKMYHRDIHPGNVLLREGSGIPVLIDFGSARLELGTQVQMARGRKRRTAAVFADGYAPPEQYGSTREEQGPWTDVYAVGAVLYEGISGEPPPTALQRTDAKAFNRPAPMKPAREVGRGRYSAVFLAAIDRALSLKPEERFASASAMRRALLQEGAPVPPEEPVERRRPWRLVAAIAAAIALAIGAWAAWMGYGGGAGDPQIATLPQQAGQPPAAPPEPAPPRPAPAEPARPGSATTPAPPPPIPPLPDPKTSAPSDQQAAPSPQRPEPPPQPQPPQPRAEAAPPSPPTEPRRPDAPSQPSPSVAIPQPSQPPAPRPQIEPLDATHVTLTNANLRAAPDRTSDLLTTVPRDEIVHATGRLPEWLRVRHRGTNGFISAELLSRIDPDEADAWTRVRRNDRESITAFLNKYPAGRMAPRAKELLDALPPPAPPAPPPPQVQAPPPPMPAPRQQPAGRPPDGRWIGQIVRTDGNRDGFVQANCRPADVEIEVRNGKIVDIDYYMDGKSKDPKRNWHYKLGKGYYGEVRVRGGVQDDGKIQGLRIELVYNDGTANGNNFINFIFNGQLDLSAGHGGGEWRDDTKQCWGTFKIERAASR
ncbi:MAG: protein kinase [Alphaproteobacteria bacterium]|nr:protein kinase [Alphaproteobacteria bacterium]